jgi:hypothetical protein
MAKKTYTKGIAESRSNKRRYHEWGLAFDKEDGRGGIALFGTKSDAIKAKKSLSKGSLSGNIEVEKVYI